MNARVEIPAAARKLTSHGHFECDLFWEGRLAVEYDSNAHHTSKTDIARDSKRRNALVSMGIPVITVTWDQLRSVVEMERVAFAVAGYLGKRLRKERFRKRQMQLRSVLLRRNPQGGNPKTSKKPLFGQNQ